MIDANEMTVEAAVRDMWQKLMKPKHIYEYETAVQQLPEYVEALRSWVKALFKTEFNAQQAVHIVSPFIKSYSDIPPLAQKSNQELAKALAVWWKQRR